MNCAEAEKSFAALLDDSLDRERLREIKNHLDACSQCSEEMTGLSESQRLVKVLAPIEPPLGLTTRVMAEVRETAHRPPLWQRLMLALPTKFPLQATAVVLISVLAAYLYQKESHNGAPTRMAPPASSLETREKADALTSSASEADQLDSKLQVGPEAGAQRQKEEPSSAPEQPRSLSQSEEQNKILDQRQPSARRQDHGSPALSTSEPNEKSLSGDQAASARLEQSLSSGAAPTKGVPPRASLQGDGTALSNPTPAVKPPASDDLREKQARSSVDGLSFAPAPASDHELKLRVKEPARDDKNTSVLPHLERFQAEPQLSKSPANLKDLDQARRRAVETGQPQTVWATIPPGQYDRFKSELAGLGNIESELPPAPEKEALSKSSDQLRIKLIILPPLPRPEAPSSR